VAAGAGEWQTRPAGVPRLDPLRQVLLDKARTEMDVHLDQRAIPDGFEAMNLAGFRVRALLGAGHNR
jgi:hypothetical protein